MYLTANFRLDEFLRSQTAQRRGRPIVPSPENVKNLERLCVMVLQPLRVSLGKPITILSGLRPAWLNAAVGGSPTSSHLEGLAADFVAYQHSPLQLCEAIERLGLPVDQCIHEFPPNGWVHVSVAAVGARARGEFLTARHVEGRAEYTLGIHA